MISQFSVICALQCPPLVLTDKPTPYNLFQTLCVSRGLQWSRRIQVALPANPHTANFACFAQARLFEQILENRQNVIVEIAQLNSLNYDVFSISK